jgi:putative flippase GtrA
VPVTWAESIAARCAGPRAQAWLLFLRFGLVGLVNTAFGYVVFAALLLMGAGSLVALVMAAVAGVAFNFQTSRRLVFRADGHGRGLRFVALYVLVLGLNWAALEAAARLGMSRLLAQALLAVPAAAISFLGQKLLVFAPAPEQA